MVDEFNVTILSNDSINKYPENVLSSFTNYMDTPLTLGENWQVGISEIFLNKFKIESNDIEIVYIYSNIIRPRIVGDQCVRCLKVLPVNPGKVD